jgi:hypothetical protein
MGDHDQTALTGGRTLRPFRDDEIGDLVHAEDGGPPEYVPDPVTAIPQPVNLRITRVLRYSGGKLSPEALHLHIRPFTTTKWESLYSSVFGTGTHEQFDAVAEGIVTPSFTPIIDHSYQVIGHLGWIDGFEICVPKDTIAKGAPVGIMLEQRRLGEWRDYWITNDLKFTQKLGPGAHFHTAPTPPAPKPPPICNPPAATMKYKPTIWEEARAGPLKDATQELRQQHNINYFLAAGGKVLIGRKAAGDLLQREYEPYLLWRQLPSGQELYDVFRDRKWPVSSEYRFLVLVDPDGRLQSVLGVEKVEQKLETTFDIALEVVDKALTVLMIIDIATIPVALFSLGRMVAKEVMIWALEVTVNREAKAALDLVLQRVRRELVGAMSGPEQAEARTVWERLKQKFWEAGNVPPRRQFSADEAKQLNKRIADRMRELGIPKKNIGAGSKIIPPGAKTPKGKVYPVADEFGDAFNASGRKRGGNVRSGPPPEPLYGGAEGGISVHGNVFDRWEGFDLWNAPTTTVEDRIDAIIAHEWSEFNGLSHWETVELAAETKLPIRPRARELLQEMAKWGNSEKAFTEFTKEGWKAIKDAGKAKASFEEKKAAAAAAKAK